MSDVDTRLAIGKRCFWVRDGEARLYTALHFPSSLKLRPTGIVICNPLGHEYVHTYRALRRLADVLADAGFAVIRFDYQGTGNSSGTMDEHQLVSRWQSNIRRQTEWMQSELGIGECGFIGFRFGAELARSLASIERTGPLALWAPLKSSRKYLREIKALSNMSDYEQLSDIRVECAGFPYSNELLQQIASLEIAVQQNSPMSETLMIGPRIGRFSEQYATSTNVQLEEQSATEYENSMLEPHLSTLPETAIRSISSFFEGTTRPPTDTENLRCIEEFPETAGVNDAVAENILWQESPRISGVLSIPAGEPLDGGTVVAMPNAGSVHNIGPNRVYVELARELAANGVPCFRFDLPNLGESVLGDAPSENHPYPANAVHATEKTVAFLRDSRGFKNVILAGICSGSYTSFRYALAENNYRGLHLAMINPLTFYWEDGMQLRLGAGQVGLGDAKYYDRAIGNIDSWKRLLTGKSSIRSILAFVCRRVVEKIRMCMRLLLDMLSIVPPTKLATELRHIAENSESFTFFISSRDIGYDLMKTEALSMVSRLERRGSMQVHFIDDGDHTFSRSRERKLFIGEFVKYARSVKRRFSRSPSERRLDTADTA